MLPYFEAIKSDYKHAEITSLILHDRKLQRYFNLLTVIEFIPAEQEPSPVLGTPKSSYCERENATKEYTIYLARALYCSYDKAVVTFLHPEKGIELKHGEELNAHIRLFNEAALEPEPASDFPLVINSTAETTIANVLPRRRTGLRVWTKIDRAKKWLSTIGSGYFGVCDHRFRPKLTRKQLPYQSPN